ncbi:MAG: cation transporter [Dysgonamonadaceae bacterium]|jgi:Cu(I)/Ag(I) efflux system membrane fusion protein|nr:cation transporter [Dysgonamonadaceae bacterium]
MKKTILLFAAIVCLTANNACTNANKKSSGQQQTATSSYASNATLKVQGVCEMCRERIEITAKSMEGVVSASWDSESKQLRLSYNAEKTSLEAISKAIAKAGHDTELDKADDNTYSALPPCCQYRG